MAIAAGVKPIRFHDLRHTFASHLIMRGKHVVEVKELIGHTKLETTMKYMGDILSCGRTIRSCRYQPEDGTFLVSGKDMDGILLQVVCGIENGIIIVTLF